MEDALRRVSKQARKTQGDMQRAFAAQNKGMKSAARQTKRSTGIMAGAWKAMIAAISVIVIKKAVETILDAGIQMERMAALMKASIGDWLDFGKTMDFLRKRSDDLGLVFQDQIKGFAQLTTAARIAGFTHQDLMDIYFGVTDAATAMQLSSEDAWLAMRGIIQVLSKGKVQAEELRGQIGERLPGAFQLFASALGMTGEELNKAMEQGQIFADTLVPFGRKLSEEFGDKAVLAARTTNAAIGRMKTAWFDFRNAIAQAGVLELFKETIQAITKRLGDPKVRQVFTRLTEWLIKIASTLTDKVIKAFDWLIDRFPNLQSLTDGLVEAWDKISKPVSDLVIEIAKLTAAIVILNKTFALLKWVTGILASVGAAITGIWAGFKLVIPSLKQLIKGLRDGTTTFKEWADGLKKFENIFKNKFTRAIVKGWRMLMQLMAGIVSLRGALSGFLIFLGAWANKSISILLPVAAALAGIAAAKAAFETGHKISPEHFFKPPADDAERLERALARMDKKLKEREKLLEKGLNKYSDEVKEVDRRIELEKQNVKWLEEQLKLQKMSTEEIKKHNKMLEDREKASKEIFGPIEPGETGGKAPTLFPRKKEGVLFGPRGPGGEAGSVPSLEKLNKLREESNFLKKDEVKLFKDARKEAEREALQATERMEKMIEGDQEGIEKMLEARKELADIQKELDRDNIENSKKTLSDKILLIDLAAQDELERAKALADEIMGGEELLANFRISLERKVALEKEKITAEHIQKIKDEHKKLSDAVNAELTDFFAEIDAEMERLNELVQSRIDAIAEFFGDRMGDAFSDWISGTKSLENAFKDMVGNILNDLARLAASRFFTMLLGGVLGGLGGGGSAGGGVSKFIGLLGQTIGGKAAGGPVGAGKPYMVGERGPELFVPGRSGSIVPNGGGGSLNVTNQVTVSAGAGGSPSDQRNLGNSIAKQITEATRMTIMQEMRPGGMMNRPQMSRR